MSQTIESCIEYFETVSEELNELGAFDQHEMYRRLIDLGKEIEPISPQDKIPENFVQGCVSEVYIAARQKEGRVYFTGSSESQVVRGYVTILIRGLSGLLVQDFLEKTEKPVEKFAKDTDLKATLTPSRTNAFGNIYQLMRKHTQIFQQSQNFSLE